MMMQNDGWIVLQPLASSRMEIFAICCEKVRFQRDDDDCKFLQMITAIDI